MSIRPVRAGDETALWHILEPTIRAGETYALDPRMTQEAALAYWLGADRETFVLEQDDGTILGSYYLRANQLGGGAHVCNAAFMTHSAARGKGIAGRMCEDAVIRAQQHGFRAMQFNFVVATNERAVRLWSRLGFATVGRIPQAFAHPTLGLVDALVMHRFL
ncbi:GNAT family N-acetyltransferase [Acetobacter sp. LMG 1627]|uniref:GNAT family N-acetyltransferase n=1 Tax=Acetobacter conturbans TaxID=1737472 RepID=A0ABX0JY21_9PROT|nr:GNAT family N-acetyltransferase [Acetobacter conturbans]NHN88208.1 GNAT family N-acetyltransferase [Acetobacter conturbans]